MEITKTGKNYLLSQTLTRTYVSRWHARPTKSHLHARYANVCNPLKGEIAVDTAGAPLGIPATWGIPSWVGSPWLHMEKVYGTKTHNKQKSIIGRLGNRKGSSYQSDATWLSAANNIFKKTRHWKRRDISRLKPVGRTRHWPNATSLSRTLWMFKMPLALSGDVSDRHFMIYRLQ